MIHFSKQKKNKASPGNGLIPRCLATVLCKHIMDRQKNLEMCMRKKFTCEVVNEFLENHKKKLEDEKRQQESLFKAETQEEKQFLDKLQNQYPLYTSQAASLYAEKHGSAKIHPFRKCTKFSKPIYEQLEGPFKPE